MEEPVFRRFPDWKFSPESYDFMPACRWPVRFEDWAQPAYLVQRQLFPVTTSHSNHPEPPEEVVRVRKRIEDQVRRLIKWLRQGVLISNGVAEPKSHDLKRQTASQEWWEQADAEFDHSDSSFWARNGSDQVLTFSDIKVNVPEATVPQTAPAQIPPEALSPPKGKRGPKPKWDWMAATREMMRLANSPDGLPYSQADIESHIAKWFRKTFDDEPAESMIRKFVIERLPPDYRSEN